MKIPSNNQWKQDNSSDVLGIIGSSTNMTFDAIGKATLAHKSVAVTSSAYLTVLKHVVSFVYFNTYGKYVAVTNATNGVEVGLLDGNGFSQYATFSPSTTLGSDALIFNNKLTVSEATSLATWDGVATVVTGIGALTSGVPHPMAIFDSNPTYKLAVGNGNLVKTYDTAFNANLTDLTLPSDFQVTSLRYRNGYLYIGTRNINGGEARIFMWNGTGSNAQFECPVGASWVFSMTEYGTTVAALVSSGVLGQVSGSTFQPLAAFPVYYDAHARWQGAGGLTLNGKCFNRGMTTIGDSIYMNIEGSVDIGMVPEMKSGIWVYNPQVGLSHRAYSTADLQVLDNALTLSSGELTTAATHNIVTGDTVSFNLVSGLVGVTAGVSYYATATATNKIKLSTSRKAVKNGTYITITGTPGSSDQLIYTPNTDQGSLSNATSGAIIHTAYNQTPAKILDGEIMWSSRPYDQSYNTYYVINTLSNIYNTGSITTQRIYSGSIDQTWNDVFNFIDQIGVSNEQVIVKAQTTFEKPTISLVGVWASATVLNTNNSAYFNSWQDIEVGYELIFIDGYGRGRTAHVTDITTSATVISLIIDESYGLAGKTCDFYATNFKKIGVYTNDNKEKESIKANLFGLNSAWLKLKIEVRGFETAVNNMDLRNTVHRNQ